MAYQDEAILPGLVSEAYSWTEVSLDTLSAAEIAPGRLVSGITTDPQLALLETKVCDRLCGQATEVEGGAGVLGAVIARDTLANHLLPDNVRGKRGIRGSLDNRMALIFPFDLERVRQYNRIRKLPRKNPEGGLTLLLAATIRSVRSSSLLLREVSYYNRPPTPGNHGDQVRRVLGGRQILEGVDVLASAVEEAAEDRATFVAGWVVKRLYDDKGDK